MGIVDDFRGNVIGLDTTPLIYFIEKNARYHPVIRPFFVALDQEHFRVVTSVITLVETLIHPLRHNQHELASRYRRILLNTPQITTFNVSPDIAQKAAEIRAVYQIRTPDAIQLATALQGGADFFLTNDHALKKFPAVDVIVVEDLLSG